MLGTMINVLTAPGETFETIVKDFNWRQALFPILLLAVINIISGTIMKEQVNEIKFEQASSWINNSNQMTDEQKDETITSIKKSMNKDLGILGILFVGDSIPPFFSSFLQWPIRIVFFTLFAMLVGNLFLGGGGTYGRMFTLTAFAYMPSVVEYIIKTPIQYISDNIMIYTGLGVLGVGEQGEFLNSFLAGIDVFAFWRVYLVAVGMSILYNKSTKSTLSAVTALWIFGIVVFAGMGAAAAGIFG